MNSTYNNSGSVDGPTFMANAGQKWRDLTIEQKQKYAQAAAEKRAEPFKGQTRDKVVQTQLKIIDQPTRVLSSVHFQFGGVGLDPRGEIDSTTIGSSLAVEFISKELKLLEKFHEYVDVKQRAPAKEDTKREDLRKLVRQKYRTCWENATGQKKAVPYLDIKKGKIRVKATGLPNGVDFEDPSSYGSKKMKAILACTISMKVCPDPEPVTMSVMRGHCLQVM
ncbi:uncharacterized protein LOC123524256 isoform X2 [Mercenaria mercenaria]|uniref:uncharacterized protein LOC123524256 isoform X2 n=1 Tax=Mercenaria mercenaria TaxID=6596 RepID=UPI00234E7E26|nr:uncharacterized protein LOC123524256 isoform X2 [Mercenaria mercenaria]